MRFVGTWITTAIATAAAIAFVPGIEAVGGGYLGPIMCALALALVNATVKPVMQVLSLPLTIVSFGIFALVVNALRVPQRVFHRLFPCQPQRCGLSRCGFFAVDAYHRKTQC